MDINYIINQFNNNIPVCISDINLFSSYIDTYKICKKLNKTCINSITIYLQVKQYTGLVSIFFKNIIGYRNFINIYNKKIFNLKDENIANIVFDISEIPFDENYILLVGNRCSILHIGYQDIEKICKMLNEKYKNILFCYSRIESNIEKNLFSYLSKNYSKKLIISQPVLYKDKNTLIHSVCRTLFNSQQDKNTSLIDVKINILSSENIFNQDYKFYDQITVNVDYKNDEQYSKQTLDFIQSLKFFYIFEDFLNDDYIYKTSNSKINIIKITYRQLIKNLSKSNISDKKKYFYQYVKEISIYNMFDLYNLLYVTFKIIEWSFLNNIPIGYGRGSCVGSLVIYLLNITKVDPIKHGLIFERFLNKDRFSMPDIDIDVCKEKRNELVQHIKKEYSKSKHSVSNIIVFLTLTYKAAIKDFGKIISNLKFTNINSFTSDIDTPADGKKKIETITQSLHTIEKLHNIFTQEYTPRQTKQFFKKKFKQLEYECVNMKNKGCYNEMIIQDLINKFRIYANNKIKELELQDSQIETDPNFIINKTEPYLDIKNKLNSLYENIIKIMSNNIQSFSELHDQCVNAIGIIKSIGVHAAGFLIPNIELEKYCPMLPAHSDGKITYITHFDLDMLTKAQFMKFDFLGLETLTFINIVNKSIQTKNYYDDRLNIVFNNNLIKITINNIDYLLFESDNNILTFYIKIYLIFIIYICIDAYIINKDKIIDIEKIVDKPKDFVEVYKIYSKGFTKGIFQFEKTKAAFMCSQIQVDNFEDIVSINALNRPGVGDVFNEFKDNKNNIDKWRQNNNKNIIYYIVKNTYGVLLFQEQIMEVAIYCANFSKQDADILRYAISKKKAELIQQNKQKFITQTKLNHGISDEEATNLFKKLEKFADYSFNKSHAVAYSYISLQTAILKAYYSFEFFNHLFDGENKNIEKLIPYIVEASLFFYRKNIIFIIIPPNVNYLYYHCKYSYDKLSRYISYNLPLCFLKGISINVNKTTYEQNNITHTIESNIVKLNIGVKILNKLIQSFVFINYSYDNFEILQNILKDLLKLQKKQINNLNYLESALYINNKKIIKISEIIKQEINLIGFSITNINIYSLFLKYIHLEVQNNYDIYVCYNLSSRSYLVSQIKNLHNFSYIISSKKINMGDMLLVKKIYGKLRVIENITENICNFGFEYLFNEQKNKDFPLFKVTKIDPVKIFNSYSKKIEYIDIDNINTLNIFINNLYTKKYVIFN